MEQPQSPRDIGLRNIIDKLAEFVARNGPEFEMITKQKQQGNPKFDFLYGGEYANYYQYRVSAEHAFLKQQLTNVGRNTNQANGQQQQQPLYNMQGQAAQQPAQQTMDGHDMNDLNANNSLYAGLNPNVSTPLAWMAQNVLPQQQQPNAHTQSPIAMNLTAQIEALNVQQNQLREQIRQSEANLSAQHSAMMAQQKKQIEEAIEKARDEALEKQAEESGTSLIEFDKILNPIIDSCTKDSISAGKNWILQHSTDSAKNNVVLQYLLKKALLDGSTFTQKLHLIYLVNDILHHCVRKNTNDLKNSLENVVIPMFCSAELIATKEQRTKLAKLLSLWESKAKFFDACVISKLQSPDSSIQEYKTNLQNIHHEITTKYTQVTKAALENYQKQHQMFITHATQQIAHLEQQKQQLEQQLLSSVLPAAALQQPPLQQLQQQQQQQQQQASKKLPALMAQTISMPMLDEENENIFGAQQQQQQQTQPQQQQASNSPFLNRKTYQNPFAQDPVVNANPMNQNDFSMTQANNFFIPDLSKPPPGFGAPGGGGGSGIGGPQQLLQNQQPNQHAQQQQQQQPLQFNVPQNPFANAMDPDETVKLAAAVGIDVLAANAALQLLQQKQLEQQQQQFQQLEMDQQNQSIPSLLDTEINPPMPEEPLEEKKPDAAYYDLPAGLMVPLILLEDYRYKPLDPEDIRLPPPAPQSERLKNAVIAFYAQPSHDRPRDNEGWEKLALYEYYKVKNAAKKQREDEIAKGERERSRSPTPIILEKPKPKNPNKRCYRSKSRSRSRTPQYQRSKSRSPTTPRIRDKPRSGGISSRSNNRTRSPRRGTPPRDRERERERGDRDKERNNERELSRSERTSTRRERAHSLTPPSFIGGGITNKTNQFIESSNKGHQMLMKMGWAGTGTGLGTKNQGINQPISGGEVRDRKDLYKGVGINLHDPYESFRKSKGAAFVHRMRSQDDKR